MREIKRDIVGAFLISQDKAIYLGEVGVYAGHLAVPGGGKEPGETDEQAVHREILEETGIDIEGHNTTKCEDINTGESEKTLRDTGERVRVVMRFIDYIVQLDKSSNELPTGGMDDFVNAKWYPLSTVSDLKLTPPTRARLIKLGYINE